MVFFSVAKSSYDSSESCCLCLGFISAGQFYVRTHSKVAHYKCARKRGWKRATRAKKKATEIPKFNQSIRVVRDGVVVKRIVLVESDSRPARTIREKQNVFVWGLAHE